MSDFITGVLIFVCAFMASWHAHRDRLAPTILWTGLVATIVLSVAIDSLAVLP